MARVLTLMGLLTILLAGCGGGGSSSGSSADDTAQTIPNNFAAKSVQVVTPDPRIGYPLQVTVSLTADAPADNVSVSVFAIEKNDDPSVEVHQTPLGTQAIPHVDVGTHDYEVDVNIPSSVTVTGPYYIGAIINPVGDLAETNTDDNTASTETTISAEGGVNVVLADMTLDRSALVINTDEFTKPEPGKVHNADAGGTLTVGAEGLEPNQSIAIEAFAKLRIMRSDTGTSHDVPLYLWNSDAARYTYAYGLDPSTTPPASVPVGWLPLGQFTPQLVETSGEDVTLNDLKRNSAHMNFYFPGKLGYWLEQELRYPPPPCPGCYHTLSDTSPTVPPPDLTASAIDDLKSFLANLPFSGTQGDESAGMKVLSFAVCVDIRPVDTAIADQNSADNESCTPLTVTLPPVDSGSSTSGSGVVHDAVHYPNTAKPWSTGNGYGTKGGGSAFSFGPIDFGETTSGDYRGYIAQVRGGIPMRIFGKPFDFASITLRGQLVPEYKDKPEGEDSGFTYELRFLNNIIDSKHFDPPNSSPKVEVTFSEEAPGEKEKDKEDNTDSDAEQQLFVGPVPVVASASVEGNIGLFYEFTIEDESTPSHDLSMINNVGPLASMEAIMSAGVGTKLFSVGVEGVLNLLKDELVFATGTLIKNGYLGDSGYDASNPIEFVIFKGDTLTNKFTGPQGALNLYAKFSIPKLTTCKWGFIKGPCIKTATIKATKNIWRSPALFEFKNELYADHDKSLEVVMPDVKNPLYFTTP